MLIKLIVINMSYREISEKADTPSDPVFTQRPMITYPQDGKCHLEGRALLSYHSMHK